MMARRAPRTRAYAPDPDAPTRDCDMAGCDMPAAYRAPKSRTELRHYWWFCLEHVRAYNASWDFYKGMSPGQIEAHLRADTAWQRPTWPLGQNGVPVAPEDLLRDPLGVLRDGPAAAPRRKKPEEERPPKELREPLMIMSLPWPVTWDDIRSRYKELAKRYHPDANGGSRDAEERLKVINQAYATLRRGLAGETARHGDASEQAA
ncbi:Molecular chaperones (DnaJ family) [Granulibacter bethesdensis]|uniref:Molecular chaperones (DnaJ family) n=1 Tax=Granulibacter bethesdensis TaxID=364410 RepID=A0AAC9KD37_9PROT|nr:J domain-containing protein [Granulibacter bethesdensis]APH53873.1 Molecular chaperones (DnaJ family) [Granulibacter bethesdensis]APH61451.1 Molecular chaperones (DnaJ family) [Granulibacter bethesdensis]